jgi:hypothetical protein
MSRGQEFLPFDVERRSLVTPPRAGRSVALSKEQAGPVLDLLGSGARPLLGVAARKRASKGLYRLVPRAELAEGLKKHGYRYAKPSSGDATQQLLDSSGDFVGRADLKAAGPSLMKLVGPAAWQVMAMATQQHYLVEISGKLSAIDAKLDELIARDEDRMLSAFDKARELAADAQPALATGEPPSANRVRELGDQMHRVDDDWRELLRRTTRLLQTYRDGGGKDQKAKGESATAVNAAWSLLLRATQALAEVSTAFAALPQPDRRAAETLRREETARIAERLDDLTALASDLFLAHAKWQADHTVHKLNHTNNPVERVRRMLTKSELAKLDAGPGPLDSTLADIAEQLSQQAEAPTAMLVDVRDDGTVLVSADGG